MTKNQQKQITLETNPREILILELSDFKVIIINMFKEFLDKINHLSQELEN